MSEPKVVQPMVVMPPMQAPVDAFDEDAERFIEDTTVPSGLTFQEWVAAHRPPPAVPAEHQGDIPDI